MRIFALVSLLIGLSINAAYGSLVVEYGFDGSGQDSSGNSEDLTLFNGASFAPGRYGQALQLDGIDDHAFVNIGNYGLTNFTVELWFNVGAFDRNVHYVSLQQDNYIVLGDYGSASSPVDTWTDGLSPINAGPVAGLPTTGEWHHLAFTFDGSDQKIYLDGVLIKTAATTGSLNVGHTGGLAIGSRYNQSTQFVEGALDNVRIHDVALSIQQLGFYVDGDVPPSTYSVGGTVSGLTGSVTLQNNGGDDIIKTTNDGFTFTAQVAGSDYAVTVSSQPTGQTCTVTNGSGTNITANITNVTVTCVTDVVPTYTVGGTVSGLTGSVTLQNNGGDDIIKTTNDGFTFTAQVDGTPYTVTVLAQPTGQTCSVTNGSGTITTADVTNVSVDCIDDVVVPPPAPMVPVPAMSEWALILLTMLLGLMVFANRRRLF